MNSLLPKEVIKLAAEVVERNIAAGRTIVTAESCTGGLVASAITEIAGSSAVLQAGFVTYSNEAKIKTLKVSEELIDTFGAVSIAVAWAMAQGALKRSSADIAVAISGVAGPGGGTANKPVGTVVFAVAERGKDPEDVVADKIQFGEDKSRADIRMAATLHALQLLLPTP
ncbi:CinA family protein [Sphingorhabdus pulchriflava]|uniref:CinA family protein n=1 Tax=Sphingorhabdus pulchriflava TaxID=2292257 RepID=A0A371BH14_9SPHN|nr:CinA family protein [Sphingorhabdus pulchriflava]RDV06838.1 CinA family protein [Sphingorhabdus pulchriflava]